MRSYKKMMARGFTLVELMIVVAIIGVLAALAIFGVTKYLAAAKSAEARNGIGAISRGAVSAWEREVAGSAVTFLATGASAGMTHQMCPSVAARVPAINDVRGAKFQPSPAAFATPEWSCLKFTMDRPTYYSYYYASAAAGGAADAAAPNVAIANANFIATAVGDLDGDNTNSEFALGGQVLTVAGNTSLTTTPQVSEFQAEE